MYFQVGRNFVVLCQGAFVMGRAVLFKIFGICLCSFFFRWPIYRPINLNVAFPKVIYQVDRSICVSPFPIQEGKVVNKRARSFRLSHNGTVHFVGD